MDFSALTRSDGSGKFVRHNSAMQLRGKIALVTGSTSGIGLAIARALAAAGCDVVLTGLGDAAQISAMARDLAHQHKIRASYIPADLVNPAEIRSLVAAAEHQLGAPQILVNNAGIQHVAPLQQFPDEQWDQIVAINLSAAFHATKACLPAMQRGEWGRVINISSAHGLVASPGKCAYVAAKHGLIGLTKVTALENAAFGITANAICPGWVRTPLVEAQVQARATASGISLREAEQQIIGEKQAILEFTVPEQIAALALFLCSDSASTVTGAAMSMDGGWVAQ
jgi:3-hydroxybutyrate dehydrogenase